MLIFIQDMAEDFTIAVSNVPALPIPRSVSINDSVSSDDTIIRTRAMRPRALTHELETKGGPGRSDMALLTTS